ncbi:MAG: dihydrolipoyl dehydrogenase, partial [Myxococcota bacterium]
MQERTVDVAILGAGTAGLNARKEVEEAGKSWVIIDPGPLGTTCARVGCMPSKLLIAAADAAHEVHGASRFGVQVDPSAVRIDGAAVMKRVRDERDRFVGFVVSDTEKIETLIRGRARFTGPNTLMVDDHTKVHFTTAVIATGSSPWIPPPLDQIPDRVQVNDDVFDWSDLPESVAVFGTGIIGLELGQALHRLGVTVVLFNPFEQVGPFSDPAVHDAAKQILGDELNMELGAKVHEIRPEGEHTQIRWTRTDGAEHTQSFEVVLAAAGRRANVGNLGLENTPVPVDARGRVHSNPRTAQIGHTHFFIAGDVAGHRPLLHEASDEGRISGANAAT